MNDEEAFVLLGEVMGRAIRAARRRAQEEAYRKLVAFERACHERDQTCHALRLRRTGNGEEK